jgi:aspartate-semialdehyde dehydrogenase
MKSWSGWLAWHGRFRADAAHGGRGRFRPYRAGVFLDLERRRQGAVFGGKEAAAPLQDAIAVDALKACDIIITCQGGDYTKEVFPKLRATGWNGHWIDAASALRMADDAVIILDPVNMNVIKDSLAKGGKNWIGGNCTVSLMLMGLGGLFQNDLIEWATSMTYQAASGAGAQNMRELIAQMGVIHAPWQGPARRSGSAILDIDRKVAETIRSDASRRRTSATPARRLADPVDRRPGRGRPVEGRVEGRRRVQQDPRPSGFPHCRVRSRSTACACASAPCAATRRR